MGLQPSHQGFASKARIRHFFFLQKSMSEMWSTASVCQGLEGMGGAPAVSVQSRLLPSSLSAGVLSA